MKVYVVMRISRESFTGTSIVSIRRDEDVARRDARQAEAKRQREDKAGNSMIVVRIEKVR